MKKIDMTAPHAMSEAFAKEVYSTVSTDDFEIPANTSTTQQDSCVIDEGFLPITSTALTQGGKAPERKNFNGLFYLSTDQRNFLQNGGVITFDENVSNAIGGYPEGAVLSYFDEDGSFKMAQSLIDDNTYNFIETPSYIDEEHWKEIKFGGGGGLEVGDIGLSIFVDETKGLRRYLNGSTVAINTNTQPFLTKLKKVVALYPSMACTEQQWQSEVALSVHGQCGKFVIDETAGTIRLPKIVMPIQGLTDLSKLGQIVTQGLPTPSHTHTRGDMEISGRFTGNNWGTWDGAFAKGGNSQNVAGQVGLYGTPGNFYASRSWTGSTSGPNGLPSVYKDGANVQQEQVQYPYFIQIATGQETQVDIVNEIELNNPFSLFECKYADHELFNLSWLVSEGQQNSKSVYVKAYEALVVEYNTEIEVGETVTLPSGTSYTKQGLSVKLSTETYQDTDFVLNTTNETFRLPLVPLNLNNTRYLIEKGEQNGINYRIYSDGYCEQWGIVMPNVVMTVPVVLLKTYKDDNYFISAGYFGTSTASPNCIQNTPKNKTVNGFGLEVWTDMGRTWKTWGYLAEGEYNDNLNLYYYVGETIQNANLIDAGRIQEQLTNKVDLDANNFSVTGKANIVNCCMPDYAQQIYSPIDSLVAGTLIQVPKDSFVVVWGRDSYKEDYYVFVTDDTANPIKYAVGRRFDDYDGNTHDTSFSFQVPKGWYFTCTAEGGFGYRIFPYKGAQ